MTLPEASTFTPFSYEHGFVVRMSKHHISSRKSISILPTPDGSFHIYADGVHFEKIATGLPAGTPLWGAVDVHDCNIKARSEILSKSD